KIIEKEGRLSKQLTKLKRAHAKIECVVDLWKNMPLEEKIQEARERVNKWAEKHNTPPSQPIERESEDSGEEYAKRKAESHFGFNATGWQFELVKRLYKRIFTVKAA